MRVLITGGLGLIGAAIATEAATAGHAVHVLDDQRANVTPSIAGAWAHTFETVEEYADGASEPVDVVIHCAAPVGPVGILHANVLEDMTTATQAAVALAYRMAAGLVVFSSSEVYGTTNPRGSLVIPDDWSHRTEYAVGKVVTEQLARRHHAETGLPTMVIRPWNVTGPTQTAGKGFVFPRMAAQAAQGMPVTVYQPGSQERAFMAAADLAHLLTAALDGDRYWDARPIDAATPTNVTTMTHLADLFGTGHRIVDPTAEHGPTFREAAAGSKLPPTAPALRGWTPLEEMVEAALNHHQVKAAA